VPIYKVHFKWKEKEISLSAKSLDLTHPYFVSIRDLIFPEGGKLIIDPSQDEVKRTFGSAEHIMLPFQTVTLIEEFKEEQPKPKIRNFTLMEGQEEEKEDKV